VKPDHPPTDAGSPRCHGESAGAQLLSGPFPTAAAGAIKVGINQFLDGIYKANVTLACRRTERVELRISARTGEREDAGGGRVV